MHIKRTKWLTISIRQKKQKWWYVQIEKTQKYINKLQIELKKKTTPKLNYFTIYFNVNRMLVDEL